MTDSTLRFPGRESAWTNDTPPSDPAAIRNNDSSQIQKNKVHFPGELLLPENFVLAKFVLQYPKKSVVYWETFSNFVVLPQMGGNILV